MTEKVNRDSPLITSVTALQNQLAELERIGGRINAIDMTSEIDVDHIQKLLARFAECGQKVTDELVRFSAQLQQAQGQAEAVSEKVSTQADAFHTRREEQDRLLERFQLLGQRVRELGVTISQWGEPEESSSDEEPAALRSRLPHLKRELDLLIQELEEIRDSARASGMKNLEKSAQALSQSLQAIHLKLSRLAG